MRTNPAAEYGQHVGSRTTRITRRRPSRSVSPFHHLDSATTLHGINHPGPSWNRFRSAVRQVHHSRAPSMIEKQRSTWDRLRRFASGIHLDSLSFGPATISFRATDTHPSSFSQIAERVQSFVDKPWDVFVMSAHNVDEVTVVDRIDADHEYEALDTPVRAPGGSGASRMRLTGSRRSESPCGRKEHVSQHVMPKPRNRNSALLGSFCGI